MQELKSRIKKMIVERLKLQIDPEALRDDQPLFGSDPGGLQLDSIDALDLAVSVFENFHVEIPNDDLSALRNVNALAAFLQEHSREQPELVKGDV